MAELCAIPVAEDAPKLCRILHVNASVFVQVDEPSEAASSELVAECRRVPDVDDAVSVDVAR